MRRPLAYGILCTALAALAGTACSNNSGTSPTVPTPASVTETFSGTLTINGAVTFPFAVSQAGGANLSLTALAPDDTVPVGVALGTWSGTACQIVLANDQANLSTKISGVVQNSGELCARVYDVGYLTQTETFTIDVTHF